MQNDKEEEGWRRMTYGGDDGEVDIDDKAFTGDANEGTNDSLLTTRQSKMQK